MNYKLKKAFTIMELMVAVGLMAAVLAGSGYIFKVAIDAKRTAGATAEIMRNLRGITDQFDRDFRGAPFEVGTGPWIYFYVASKNSDPDPNNWLRADRIRFVTTGDFQSVGQYNGKTIAGNVASVCYSQALDPNCYAFDEKGKRAKILTRRQSIFTSDTSVPNPVPDPCEYIPKSFMEWAMVDYPAAWMAAGGNINVFFDQWVPRPASNPAADANMIPIYMAKGVDNFTIQIAGDPNATTGSLAWWPTNGEVNVTGATFSGDVKAIKFTFTLYDSKGIIKNGLKFTHIVYLKQ
jgi:type II secretory pathway pseudopilin PulG